MDPQASQPVEMYAGQPQQYPAQYPPQQITYTGQQQVVVPIQSPTPAPPYVPPVAGQQFYDPEKTTTTTTTQLAAPGYGKTACNVTLFGKQFTKKTIIIIAVIVILVLILILGVGLGVGLKKGSKKNGRGKFSKNNPYTYDTYDTYDTSSYGDCSDCSCYTDPTVYDACMDLINQQIEYNSENIDTMNGI